MTKVGLGDLHLYAPAPRIDLKQVVAARVEHNPRLERHLERACRTTGQRAIRFPEPWEDSATLAAAAASPLLADERIAPSLRYLAVGTETGSDHSKPVSAYVQGMLRTAGRALPEQLSSFQVQHACAGATLSLLSVASLVGLAAPSETGLVIASDVARYETGSTAEITQGAGAAALLVERDPRLMELDLASLGLCSRDVDDFFRPLGAPTARVKGQYSIQNYLESLEIAFLDHCRRRGAAPDQVLRDTDMFVLHAPFRNMPMMAMLRLLERHLGLGEVQGEAFLDERGFHEAIDPIADIGNTYSAAMYFALGFLLADRHAVARPEARGPFGPDGLVRLGKHHGRVLRPRERAGSRDHRPLAARQGSRPGQAGDHRGVRGLGVRRPRRGRCGAALHPAGLFLPCGRQARRLSQLRIRGDQRACARSGSARRGRPGDLGDRRRFTAGEGRG